ncbi:sulfite reductase [NADPH] flavoprotein component [Umbelopsis nana]
MFASTALIASLLKSRSFSPELLTVDDAPTAVGTPDLDAASSASSIQTIVDEDALIELKSKLANAHIINDLSDDTLSRLVNANLATAYIAYGLSDLSFVYPGLPTGYLGESVEQWAAQNIANVHGQSGKVAHMDTRAGALAAVHGALQTSPAAVTVLTSSQGLLTMIPNMHVLAQSKLPVVVHVGAYALDNDLELTPEVDSVLAARNTGFAFLASNNAQEAHDMALAAHVIAKSTSLPILHYFDGVKATKEIEKTDLLSYAKIASIAANVSAVETSFADAYDVVENVLSQVGKAVGREYHVFEYSGASDAETVIVTLGAGSQTVKQAVGQLAAANRVGILAVRLCRPWSEAHFLNAIPKTTKRVIVLEQGDGLFAFNGPLFLDVAASFRFGNWDASKPRIVTAQSANYGNLRPAHLLQLLSEDNISFVDLNSEKYTSLPDEPALLDSTSRAIFWEVSKTHTASHVSSILSKSLHVQTRIVEDSYRPGGAAVNSHLRFSKSKDVGAYAYEKASFIAVQDIALIKEYDILATSNNKATVLLNGPWKNGDEIEPKLTNEFKLRATQLDIQLYTIDVASIAQNLSLSNKSRNLIFESAFLQLNKAIVADDVSLLSALYEDTDGPKKSTTVIQEVHDAVKADLTKIELLPPWTILEISDDVLPKVPADRAASNEDAAVVPDEAEGAATVGKWHQAAWDLIFSEAYATKTELRPDLHEDTFVVKCTENRRLTPSTYDRNVFHLEFDTANSGLKYNLGDALGVHGLNDEEQVQKFLDWYGVNGEDVIALPANEAGQRETRTLFQLFTQTLDIFGRPSKKFYEALADFATDPKEREQLLFLISAEGKEEYKKRVDETVTYEDLLREFTSAKPSVQQLATIIAPVKPRHYSIASSQKMHPNSVHLLVVAVDWQTSTGETRFGQCTRYLSNLKLGSNVTVSIKPSVMKLPPLDSQPVIMAGLGTGMAPFRAFIQERAVLKAAGVQVGPMVLYFGSRNRRNEYLYGEELEAYHAEGLLTHMGLAFSRDQKQKVYIQHKMQEDSRQLYEYLINEQAHFYLCGPTWPVPDVKDAVVYGLKQFGGIEERAASDLIEEWKEKERYILEVY